MNAATLSGPDRSPRWTTFAASVTGRQHRARNEPGQDRAYVSQWISDSSSRPLLVIATADGAGSARRSWAGAWAACRAIRQRVESIAADPRTSGRAFEADFWTPPVIECLFEMARRRVSGWSRAVNARPEELATTLSVAIAGADFAMFAQVGDGLTGFADDPASGGWRLAIMPDSGEFAGETTFLTAPDWRERLLFAALDHAPARIFVATDGIGPILFDSRAGALHSPFLDPLFRVLEQASGVGLGGDDRLARFLASDRVSDVCQDDLTLVLARFAPAGGQREVDENGPGR